MFPFPDRTLFERLADEHRRAWTELAQSAQNVASLPGRTLMGLLTQETWQTPGGTEHDPLAEARAAMAHLAGRLEAETEKRLTLEAERRELESLIDDLRRTYGRLESEVTERVQLAVEDQKLGFYRTMEPLLTQLPLARHAVETGRDLAAEDLLALLGPLDEVLTTWGFTPIGEVGQEVVFDPGLHQVASGAAPEAGTAATVRHVGWRRGDQILRRARVARK
jgi:molecular chaperone GrpE (heat shock protein)